MDGKTFKMVEFAVGSTAPPFHCRCRSAIAPYFNDEFDGERAARDEEGKYYTVPENMKYEEWYEELVNKSSKQLNPYPSNSTIAQIILSNRNGLFQFSNVGEEDKLFKKLIVENGADGLPQHISQSTFDKLKENGSKVYYRDVKEQKFIDQFINGDLFIGQGVNGNGIYISDNYKYSLRYGGYNADNVVSILIDDKAKVIRMDVLKKEIDEFLTYAKKNFSKEDYDVISQFVKDSSKFAFLKGYDIIDLLANKIVLNRTVLKVVQ